MSSEGSNKRLEKGLSLNFSSAQPSSDVNEAHLPTSNGDRAYVRFESSHLLHRVNASCLSGYDNLLQSAI